MKTKKGENKIKEGPQSEKLSPLSFTTTITTTTHHNTPPLSPFTSKHNIIQIYFLFFDFFLWFISVAVPRLSYLALPCLLSSNFSRTFSLLKISHFLFVSGVWGAAQKTSYSVRTHSPLTVPCPKITITAITPSPPPQHRHTASPFHHRRHHQHQHHGHASPPPPSTSPELSPDDNTHCPRKFTLC